MKHNKTGRPKGATAPLYLKLANARAAIPRNRWLSANQMFLLQDKPRLPMRELEALCEWMIHKNEIDFMDVGRGTMRYYRWKQPTPQTSEVVLACPPEPTYTTDWKNEFLPPTAQVDYFAQTLYPLKQGKAVHLSMDDPALARLKKRSGSSKRLVVLTPGSLIGLAQDIVLVSVIGAGSSLIRPSIHGQKVANLVLAGMPAKLATLLMNQLHLIFRSN